MVRSKVSGQFVAAMGLDKLMERAAEAYLHYFYRKLMIEYGKEMRYERARLLRQVPLDYRRVREMDRSLDEVTARLSDIEFEQTLRK